MPSCVWATTSLIAALALGCNPPPPEEAEGTDAGHVDVGLDPVRDAGMGAIDSGPDIGSDSGSDSERDGGTPERAPDDAGTEVYDLSIIGTDLHEHAGLSVSFAVLDAVDRTVAARMEGVVRGGEFRLDRDDVVSSAGAYRIEGFLDVDADGACHPSIDLMWTFDVSMPAADVVLNATSGSLGTDDSCGSQSLSADFDGDGCVSCGDLDVMMASFGTPGPDGDVNGDGFVNFADLSLLHAQQCQGYGCSSEALSACEAGCGD